MHSINDTFEELKLKKLLSVNNISYMRTGIRKKFPDCSCERHAQLFSNLVHQFLDRKMSNFTDTNKRIIKNTLIKNAIEKSVFEMSYYDVFNACIQIKTSSNVQSACILNELYAWTITVINKDIPKSEFISFVRNLKSAKITIENVESTATDFNFNTEYEKYIQIVKETETDLNNLIEQPQSDEREFTNTVEIVENSPYDLEDTVVEINSTDTSSKRALHNLKILSLVHMLLHKLLYSLNVFKIPVHMKTKFFKVRLLSVFMYIYLNISSIFFANILPHFIEFKSNPLFSLRKFMDFILIKTRSRHNLLISSLRNTIIYSFKNVSIRKRMACILVIIALIISTSYYFNVYSIIGSYIIDTNDENLSNDKILDEYPTKEKDFQITYDFPASLISSFELSEDQLEENELSEDVNKVTLEEPDNKQENLVTSTEQNNKTLYEMLPSYKQYKMRATAYDLSIESCGKDLSHPQYGITASGARAKKGRTVAVDKSLIPLRTKLYIVFPERYSHMNGIYVAEDTGSKIKGNKIDIFFGEDKPGERIVHAEALQFGVREVTVYILPSNHPSP